ncbi:MAG: hypothetical protein IPN76_34870 [Saprospiraceae bacterium]|nr:hypothetical protein [Saprospiraceae bacterium]
MAIAAAARELASAENQVALVGEGITKCALRKNAASHFRQQGKLVKHKRHCYRMWVFDENMEVNQHSHAEKKGGNEKRIANELDSVHQR